MSTSTMVLRRVGTAVAAGSLALVGSTVPAFAANNTGHNPPGSNGTVKIDENPVDDSLANDPHVGCTFAVKFFNFDTNQRATITFDGQAPTGGGQLWTSGSPRVVSTDPARGAKNDPDEIFRFDTTQQPGAASDGPYTGTLNLTSATPQAQQGYHVKLTVTLADTGTAKHKVFWIAPCGSGGGGVLSTETPTPTPTPTLTPTKKQTPSPTPTPTESGAVLNESTPVTTPSASGAAVLGEQFTQGSTAGSGATGASRAAAKKSSGAGLGSAVLGVAFARSGSLPFTGAAGIVTLIVLALAAMAVGTVLLLASRRRSRGGQTRAH